MTADRTITNHFPDFRLLNVASTTRHPEQRGPYMVVQTGSAPDDPEMRECTFALTRRGTWLHCFLFFMMPKPVRRNVAVFESVADVTSLTEGLTGRPVVETMASLPELLGDADFRPVADDPASEALLAALRNRPSDTVKP